MTRALRFLARALATCFFLTFPIERFSSSRGWRLSGAGLIGSLAGVLSLSLLPNDRWGTLCVLLGALLLSVVTSEIAEEDLGRKDDQRIVIDEWVGYLVSVAWLPLTPLVIWGGFVLFRIFDSTKLLGINRLARLPGGWGIVMDDIAAAVLVNLILHVVLLCPLVKPIG